MSAKPFDPQPGERKSLTLSDKTRLVVQHEGGGKDYASAEQNGEEEIDLLSSRVGKRS